jgi:tryptophan synthase beta chain
MLMHTLGHDFIPASIHAGGLRYHGMAPSVSHLHELGLIEAVAHHQTPCFDAALSFARAEGHLVAPETSHAIKEAMDEALRCKESGEAKVIAFNASGHGHFDMGSYEKYFAGQLLDYDYPEEKVQEALAKLPVME